MGNGWSRSGGVSASKREAAIEKFKLTEQQSNRVCELFRKCATNGRWLTFKDFRRLYTQSRFDHAEGDIEAVFRALAVNGRIPFDGFVRLSLLCSRLHAGGADRVGGSVAKDKRPGDVSGDSADKDRMQILFNVMDTDGSGTISESEFHRFILNFVDDKAAESNMFDKLDNDNSKTIDFNEFLGFCRSHRRVYQAMCSYVFPID